MNVKLDEKQFWNEAEQRETCMEVETREWEREREGCCICLKHWLTYQLISIPGLWLVELAPVTQNLPSPLHIRFHPHYTVNHNCILLYSTVLYVHCIWLYVSNTISCFMFTKLSIYFLIQYIMIYSKYWWNALTFDLLLFHLYSSSV